MQLRDSIFAKQLAKAALQWTKQNDKNLEVLRKDLVVLLQLSQESVWEEILQNRSLLDEEKLLFLQKIYSVDATVLPFVFALLVKKRQICQINSVVRQMFRQEWGCVDVITATLGSVEQNREIRQWIIGKQGDLCGIRITVDPSIMGGCILFNGKEKMDVSISGSLQRIKQSLHRFSRENKLWAGI